VLTPFRELLEERRAAGAAVGAFTCYDVTTALGVIRAAEAREDPVMLLVGDASFAGEDGRLLVQALLAVAHEARVPACVQLDHASDRELIAAALGTGIGAVMADGSRLPFDENTAFVRAIRAVAGDAGVEAELGHVEGGEDVAAAASVGAFTNPDEAAAFVAATGADCLAVSIGNVHGRYATTPALDWDRLAAVRHRVDVPLSLHGASGLPDADVRRAIQLGISKLNVNTELRARYLDELERRLPEVRDGLRLLELERSIVAAVSEVVSAKLEVLSAR
jgi:tagatose 1,6-diphosphate aldolase GatY/KbaY